MVVENIIEICVAIDVAILSIAYPIIVDKISTIGEKYSSQYIPVLFDKEFPQQGVKIPIGKREYRFSCFTLVLLAPFISFIFLIFPLEPLWGLDCWFINNSAKLLVLVLTVFLVVSFFVWLNKVGLYNGKSKSLLTHIIRKYDESKAGTETRDYCLKSINEITYYAIDKQDEHLQETLLEFYHTLFANIRRTHDKSKPLVYPIDLYLLVNKLNQIAAEKNTKLKAIEHRAVSGTWLLGENFEYVEISTDTYRWLWRNIYTICNSPRLVKMFLENSSQYFDFTLSAIESDYDSQINTITQEQIDKRNEERNKFLEFHYALGGLMLYRKQYTVLKHLFVYTQSQPPEYVLLPKTMTEVFDWFERFSNRNATPVEYEYSFPELDNLGNMQQVSSWICCYVAVLFVRQYSLLKYYSFQDFTAPPNLPDDVLKLRDRFDNILYFESCLNRVLDNHELIAELGFGHIVKTKKAEFSSFIKDLEGAIKNKIEQQKLNAELSTDKIRKFYSESKKIISKAFEEYKSIFVKKDEKHSDSELKLRVDGAKTLMSKSAFTDNDITYLNYATFLAGSIVTNNIKRFIPNAFFISRTKRYLLNRDNILLALDRIIGRNNDIVIVGVNIDYQLKEILKKSGLAEDRIRYIPSTEKDSKDTLFVLRERDLPAIEHKKIDEKEKNESINEEINLSVSVIDINKPENAAIKSAWNLENVTDKEDPKVQLTIDFLSVIYWRNDRKIIQINIASEYREQGIQNDLNDVEPL